MILPVPVGDTEVMELVRDMEMPMQRYDVSCPTCSRRLRLMGQSSEAFGDPPERYYRCLNGGAKWTYDRARNMPGRGVPDDLTQGGTTSR